MDIAEFLKMKASSKLDQYETNKKGVGKIFIWKDKYRLCFYSKFYNKLQSVYMHFLNK